MYLLSSNISNFDKLKNNAAAGAALVITVFILQQELRTRQEDMGGDANRM